MSLDFSSLSIDAVGGARDAQSEAKINQQAQNNVKRARAAADLRGTSTSFPAQAPAPAPAPAPPAKKAADPKVLARKASQISKFLSNPLLSADLQGIIQPTSKATEADLDFVLEQIRERLNSGMGPAAVKALWLKAMIMAEQPLTRLPPQAAIPPGSHNYAAMRMNELNREFEQLAIEYDHLFCTGPIPRLLMKTLNILSDYKMAVESGQMPMLIDAPPAEEEPPAPEPSPFEETESSAVPKVPPPMKIYPDPVPSQAEFIEPMPQAPVFSSDIAATSTGKSVTRGRGKKRGGI
jgi:hypothetical protein